ncbi:MAG: outer membrane beta-barrel protein [Saprospiraceae bacterium]|nr:outer membrane beta-barrel protein [Saprospiraceae bacterium]
MRFNSMLLAMLFCQLLFAQQDTMQAKSPFSVSGNADLYFRYGLNKTASSTIPSYAHARPGLGWINLLTEGEFKRWGFLLELGAGERAKQLYSSEGEDYSFLIQGQAYLKLNDKWKTSFGAFTTHFNYEWTEPGSNGNYSNTFIYTIIPASYTGLRMDYAPNETWSFMLGVFADSDRRVEENKGKHLGGQANYASEKLNATANFITGNDGDTIQVFMTDCYGDYAFSDKFKLGWELYLMFSDHIANGKSAWQGLALYFQQQFTPRFSLNLRSEILHDPKGYWFGYTGSDIFSNTLTGKFKLKPFVLQQEIRLDHADHAVFETKKSNFVHQEVSFLLGASVFF